MRWDTLSLLAKQKNAKLFIALSPLSLIIIVMEARRSAHLVLRAQGLLACLMNHVLTQRRSEVEKEEAAHFPRPLPRALMHQVNFS